MCPSEVSDIDDSLYGSDLSDRGVVFWAISDENESVLRDFQESFDLQMPVLLDPGGQVRRKFQGTMAFPTAAFPQLYVIDDQGKLLYYSNRHNIEELRAVLEGALE